jgi:hypothetical protein
LAAGTYDRSVGLSLFTLQITHKIDEHTDTERDHVVNAITGADPAAEVRVIRDFSTGYHTRNGGGDTIITDGDLPIVDLRKTAAAPAASAMPPSDSRNKRPAPTIVGAAFVGARAAAALLLALSMVLFREEHVGSLLQPGTSPVLTEAQAEAAVTIATVVVLLFALVDILLAWFVFLGRNWARTVAMALSTVAICMQAFDVLNGGPDITLQSNLPGLALDILLLLALSSKRSRDYARRPRKEPKRYSGRAAY